MDDDDDDDDDGEIFRGNRSFEISPYAPLDSTRRCTYLLALTSFFSSAYGFLLPPRGLSSLLFSLVFLFFSSPSSVLPPPEEEESRIARVLNAPRRWQRVALKSNDAFLPFLSSSTNSSAPKTNRERRRR